MVRPAAAAALTSSATRWSRRARWTARGDDARVLLALAGAGREHADDPAAADRRPAGGARDESAHDEVIAGQRAERRGAIEAELREAGRARRQGSVADEHERREHLRGAVVDEHLRPRGERAGRRAQVAQLDVEDVRAGELAGMREQIAAREVVDGDAAEVEGRAMAGRRALDRRAVHLDAAHACRHARRDDRELVAGGDLAAEHGAGDDRAEALDREHAVDRQPEHAGLRAGWQLVDRAGQRAAQVVEPGAGARGHRHHRRVGQERAGDGGADLAGDHLDPLGVDEIALRQHDQAAPHAEQVADVEVLARLRHHALVGGDHEHDEVEPGRARDHRLDEPLVSGDVDDDGDGAVAECEAGEPELGRDAARLLDREAVGVDPGQRADERRLAVIDVPGGPDDDRMEHALLRFVELDHVAIGIAHEHAAVVGAELDRPARQRDAGGGERGQRRVEIGDEQRDVRDPGVLVRRSSIRHLFGAVAAGAALRTSG